MRKNSDDGIIDLKLENVFEITDVYGGSEHTAQSEKTAAELNAGKEPSGETTDGSEEDGD
jgi:hypothetical protein